MSRYASFRSLITAFGGLAVAGGLLASYAANVEPRWVEVVRMTLSLPRLPPALEGLTLAQISDLHAGYFLYAGQIRRLVSTVNALRPEITVITLRNGHR